MKLQPLTMIIYSGVLALLTTSCGTVKSFFPFFQAEESAVSPTSSAAISQAPSPESSPTPIGPTTEELQAIYKQALDVAQGAQTIAQSAQSPDDWQLVANRWQEAIDLLATIPQGNENYQEAQKKIPEYKNYLNLAIEKGKLPPSAFTDTELTASSSSEARVSSNETSSSSSEDSEATNSTSTEEKERATEDKRKVTSIPIVRRIGEIPVVQATLNGNFSTEMAVVADASRTVITQTTATSLGITPDGELAANTIKEKGVNMPSGKVSSLEVLGIKSSNLTVGISPKTEAGILGRDFFRRYDITITDSAVELRRKR